MHVREVVSNFGYGRLHTGIARFVIVDGQMRSGATGRLCRESVVQRKRRFVLARIPVSRISLATKFSEQGMPIATNSR